MYKRQEYSELLPKQPESIFTTVMDATDPGFLADFIAQNSNLRYQDKQSVLELSLIHISAIMGRNTLSPRRTARSSAATA